ncbi:MAG: peptide chain release factor 2 [Caldimicrobium sp.]
MKGETQREKLKNKSDIFLLYKNIDPEKILRQYQERLDDLRRCLDPLSLKRELEEIETKIQKIDSWNAPELRHLLKLRAQHLERINLFEKLEKKYQDLIEWYHLYKEENSIDLLEAFFEDLRNFEILFEAEEAKILLSEEYDHSSAIVSLHAGTGGTDAQDFAEMLLRMYTRWAEKKGYRVKLIDYLAGDEAGIKNAVLHVEGEWAYGLLKGEKGIHRLIRISPFDANARRHTSFVSVTVIPEIEEEIEVEIRSEDLKIETMRASGHGGQHVNKTESAVRITHIPTGIVVTCQNERSQHLNKSLALKILKSKLYQIEKQKLEEKKESLIGTKKEITWGNQIRSYILHPYKVIKDHRTQSECYKVDEFLDGELDNFIRDYLLWYSKNKTQRYLNEKRKD